MIEYTDSQIKFLFVRNDRIFKKVDRLQADINSLKKICVIYGERENSLAAIEAAGRKAPVESYKPHWSEVANIIYTSGTTGDPKGVP